MCLQSLSYIGADALCIYDTVDDFIGTDAMAKVANALSMTYKCARGTKSEMWYERGCVYIRDN